MKQTKIWWKRIILCGLIISAVAISMMINPKGKKIVLTFGMFAGNQWDVPNDDCYRIIDETIKEFEEKYPNVKIEYESGILKNDYSEWISQKALQGDLPDVFMVLSEDFNTFSSIGMLKKLDELIEKDDKFNPKEYYTGCYESGSVSGSQYALPYESVPTLMFVNKSLLKKEQIKMPKNDWSWEDFYRICKEVTKDKDGDGRIDQFGVYDYNWEDAIYSNGGKIFTDSGKECNLTSDQIENSILFAKKIQKLSGYQRPSSKDFDMGKVAFRPMEYSKFRTYKPYPWKINKYFEFEWDCIKLPQGEGKQYEANVDNLLMGISKETKNSQMAWEFLKMLTYNQQTQEKLFQYSYGVSPLKKVTHSSKTKEILEADMGNDTTVQIHLLDEVMKSASKRQQFRNYDEIMDYMDNEITRILMEEEGFDEEILKLKKNIDNMLNK